MAVKTYVIDNNESRVPFFGDKMSFVTGLDPLGLQNPSVKTYTHLLPGLNNVTGQIRNYSFYCWLLGEYAKEISSTDKNEQKSFIRKAEYVIALISKLGSIDGISGGNYATNRIAEGDTYNLDTGIFNADGTTINTYWQYGFGIFGQYYIGSLRQIGLIDEPKDEQGNILGIYRRTAKVDEAIVSGEDLAKAFEAAVDSNAREQFLAIVRNQTTVSRPELLALVPHFNLRQLNIEDTEWELLIQLLLSNDNPNQNNEEATSFRKQTIIQLLNFANEQDAEIYDRAFTTFAYNQKGTRKGQADECLTGWYYYQFNDYWQIACTAILNGCLSVLETEKGPAWMNLQELLEVCFTRVEGLLSADDKVRWSSTFTIKKIAIDYTEYELYQSIANGVESERLYYGFLLVFKVFQTNLENLEDLKRYAESYALNSNYDAFSYYSSKSTDETFVLSEFFKRFLHNNVLNLHQLVAYRKMGGGNQSTQKFIIDEGLIRQIDNFEPGFTGPRIGNLIAFLNDLRLLNETGELTQEGQNILSSQK